MYFISLIVCCTELSSIFAMTCRIWEQRLPAIKNELFQVLFGIGKFLLCERSRLPITGFILKIIYIQVHCNLQAPVELRQACMMMDLWATPIFKVECDLGSFAIYFLLRVMGAH